MMIWKAYYLLLQLTQSDILQTVFDQNKWPISICALLKKFLQLKYLIIIFLQWHLFMLGIKTAKEILDHLWIFKLVLWLTIDEGYSNGYVQPQYSPDQTSAYGQWNCRNFIFLWMSFQRVDPATMADPPPSGSPQESTSPEVGSQQCYVGKRDLTPCPR